MVGSAQETTEKLMLQRELFGANRFIGQVDLGGLPRTSVLGFRSGVHREIRVRRRTRRAERIRLSRQFSRDRAGGLSTTPRHSYARPDARMRAYNLT
ncbi:hypothetical protein [Streptomyces sp. NPDC050804]|uniref:hypothetical protein n=1 Tax=Streptomyces sp. NPDC050804 TaxID=3154745 RepID=UPI00343DC8AE